MKKRLLSILTTLALCLTLLPTAVWAASTPETLTFDISEGPVTITDGTTPGKIRVAYGANQSTGDIDPSNMITVTGRTVNQNRGLVIKTTTPVTVRTDDLHIDNSGVEFAYAMSLDYIGASATMILSGHNYFAGGRDKAGIMVHENASLTIQGDGSVTAKGGAGFYGGAGIGGEGEKRCGQIIINGGTVSAIGGSDAPAIGSGSGASSSGSLTGSGDAWVTASKFGTDTSGFNGFLNGAVSGSVKLTQSRSLLNLTIPSGTSLTIPSGMELTVTGTLKIDGFAVIDGGLTVTGTLEQCDPTQYAPVLDSRTSNTITLKPSTGARYGYSTDGSVPTTWQDNPVFTGLSESTQYTFFISYESATQFYHAGTSQGLQVHTLPHLIDTWKAIDADQHRGHCPLCGDAQLVEPHDFSANATHVPGTADELPYDVYSCTVCGYEKRVYDTSAAMTLELQDSDDDGWNGARLLSYRNGQFWQSINMTDGSTKTVSLPYADDIVYSFRWEKGNYDSEVGLTVTLPGQSTPIYEKSDFSSVEDGELLLLLNAGDYTAVQDAVAAIPADLSIYTPASVQPLLDVVDAVNWELPPSRQEEIDGFAPDIMNRIAALEADPDGEAEGRFHLSAAAEDLYITATGWRWGEQGTETPYTGAYRLGGTSTHRVIVESGAVNISIFELNLTHATDAPFVIDSGASVDLTLLGRNTLKHTDNDYGPAALNVPTGATLTITRESTGSLLAYSAEDGAGIGGNDGQGSGPITINGGKITAISDDDGAGIGSGYYGDSGPITINGGTITAISDDDGAGIGSGRKGNSGTITINGGTITAISEDDGAGIGSGYDRTSGPITINGGTITAISEDDGDGIGAGDSGTPSSITISGGTIIAKSEHESAMSVAPDLSALTTYRWRSAESDPYTVGNLVWDQDAGYLEIIQTLSVSFDPNGGSGTMDPVTVDYGATYLFPENGFTAPEGKRFAHWAIDSLDGDTTAVPGGGLTILRGTTAYAVWEDIPASTGGGGGGGRTSYAVSTGKTGNGTLSLSDTTARRGDTVTVTVKPDKGYTLETLTVTDSRGSALTLTDKGSGKFAFTMPSGSVTVNATFMEDNSILNFFVDVPASAYYYDAVKWAAEQGITGGTDENHFSPDASCTRAQIVTFLWRAAGSPVVNYILPFEDVAESSYYAEAVRWAASQGIVSGVSPTRFGPDLPCTRAQAMTFLYGAMGSPAVTGGSGFLDVDSGAYYAGPVAWAVKNHITSGTGNGLFGTENICTRAQIVTFLFGLYEK